MSATGESQQIPLVSICLPNLNTRPFLEERIESILGQTLQNWELIIVDDYSTDGAWELLKCYADSDSRMSLFRGPQQGLYPGWNAAIQRARGDYVYIATSDDTMPSNCLESLVAALDRRPDCDIAHCPLRAIDTNGKQINMDWYRRGPFISSSASLSDKEHVRFAPFDGLLHLSGQSVYCSITQLMLRRKIFDRIGFFESTWGPMGDFNWNMRAALVSNTIHVPTTWGGWRTHDSQATKASSHLSAEQHSANIEHMIDHALHGTSGMLPKSIREKIGLLRTYLSDTRKIWQGSRLRRSVFVANSLITGSVAARHYMKYQLGLMESWQTKPVDVIRKWMDSQGITEPLMELDVSANK
jgi:glycosyltransferase involved in cell wall biosynthesis